MPDSSPSVGPLPSPEPARAAPWVPLLPYQRRDIENPARFMWNNWSRQTGKSFTKSLRRLLRALERKRSQIFLSAGERQSRELMAKVRQHCQALRIAFDYRELDALEGLAVKQLEVILPGGPRILALPANPQTARGYTGDVFLDEFAMHRDDREIWAAMFPILLREDGELDVASTPRGRENLFCRLRDNPRFERSILTLPQAVEQGLDVDVEALREAMGDEEIYRQEFLCEFLDDSSAFLTESLIASCENADLTPARSLDELFEEDRPLAAGVDIGRVHDLTVLWVWAETIGEPRTSVRADVPTDRSRAMNALASGSVAAGSAVRACGQARSNDNGSAGEKLRQRPVAVAAIVELKNAPFREQAEMLAALLRRPNLRHLAIDAGGLGMQLAEQLVEQFGKHRVEPVAFTPRIKTRLALGLRAALESRQLAIPADLRLRRDWLSLRRAVGAAGDLILTADRGPDGHADRFWAAALALHAARLAPPAAPEAALFKPLQFARSERGAIW